MLKNRVLKSFNGVDSKLTAAFCLSCLYHLTIIIKILLIEGIIYVGPEWSQRGPNFDD